MIKAIFIGVVGAVLIVVITLFGGHLYYNVQQKKYKQDLENVINDKYLEGRNAIGALRYREKRESEPIRKASVCFPEVITNPIFDKRIEVSWGDVVFDCTAQIRKCIGKYEWWCDSYSNLSIPYLLIIKKTDRGYDLIGENIIGIGITSSYPKSLITHEQSTVKGLSNENIVFHNYTTKFNLVDSYISHLKMNKYSDITIRDEIKQDGLTTKYIKMDLLNNLVHKSWCPKDSSLNFRTNKYFELKVDDDISSMGVLPITGQIGTYGNQFITIFTNTITMHYSIQENIGYLEQECKKMTYYALFVLELIYTFLFVSFLKRRYL